MQTTNKQPNEAELIREGLEACQLYQQWNQLLIQEGKLYRKFEDQYGDKKYSQLVVTICQGILMMLMNGVESVQTVQ